MADKSKDTGTGGINLDGTVYTPDVGLTDTEGGAQGPYSSGDVAVDKTVKDISKPTRETFAKYLSKTTLATQGSSPHPNVYPVGAGEQSTVTEITLKDTSGNPMSPGPQNNEAKFAAGFNNEISSNNPAGIKKGLAAGDAPDGNTLLPDAVTPAPSGGNFIKFVASIGDTGLKEPIKKYTADIIDVNLFDYDSAPVELTDGTLNQPASGRRYIKALPVTSTVQTDGGTSKNILGPDNEAGDYTLTEIDAAKVPASITSNLNAYAVDGPITVSQNGVDTLYTFKVFDELYLTPLSATDAQANISNSKYFTRDLKTVKVGTLDSFVPYSTLQSSYTQAYTKSTNDPDDKKRFELKRGRTFNGGLAPDGHKLLPNAAKPSPQTLASEDFIKFISATSFSGLNTPLKTYVTNVLDPNLYSPFDAQPPIDIVIGDGSSEVVPSFLRNVKYIPADVNVKTEGGTSKNILSNVENKYVLQPLFAAEAAHRETTSRYNRFTVDSHADVAGINFFRPSSADPLAETSNSQKFGSIQIGVNPSVFSKGKLTIQDPRDKTKNLPDGNELLPNAAIPGPSGGPYIRSAIELQEPIKTYTDDIFGKNLRPIGEVDIYPRTRPFDEYFYGSFFLVNTQPVEDAGTFDNVTADPTKRWLTKNDALRRVKTEVAGDDLLAGQRNYYTPFDTTKFENYQDPNVAITPTGFSGPFFDSNNSLINNGGYPQSPTIAQSIVEENATWKFEPDLRNVSSYSSEGLTVLQIKRGKSDFNGPNGNELLKKAAEPSKATTFIKTDAKLKETIGSYVTQVLRKNRYKPTDDETSASNVYIDPATPGAEYDTTNGGRGSIDAKIENISDDVSSSDRPVSFVERTTLYRPRSLTLGESPQNTALRSAPIAGYDFRRLSRIGTILQLRAAGEITFLTQDSADPRANTQQLAALLPGAGQLGAGIPFSRELLNVDSIIENLTEESEIGPVNSKAQYEGELIDFNRTFEGTVNTCLEKFSGFSALGMLILAALLIVVILVAFEVLLGPAIGGASFSQPAKSVWPSETPRIKDYVRSLGSFSGRGLTVSSTNIVADIVELASNPAGGSALPALFGILPTHNRAYRLAVQRGVRSFFGLGKNPPPALAYPGSVVVNARAIVRSATRVVLAFVDLVKLFATGNIFSGIFQLIEIVDIIRNSRLIKSCNQFAQIGDKQPHDILSDVFEKSALGPDLESPSSNPAAAGTLETNEDALNEENGLFGGREKYEITDETFDIGKRISEIDCINDNNIRDFFNIVGQAPLDPDNVSRLNRWISTAHVKNRLKSPDQRVITNRLAWSTYRSPSYLLSQPVMGYRNLSELPGSHLDPETTFDKRSQVLYDYGETGRIDQKSVQSLENLLDGEHVPFYFQDLRTNEILTFHAFLTSLSDDYSVNYETTEGIGRIEPVRSYKNTSRKVGLSFIVAALDDSDFNHMWEKINKLTTLLYPQWTGGKSYENPGAGYKFEKPFTQLISASPMIRLRIGNLIRSNYSRFNLAGVFGLKDADNTAIADPKYYDENKDPRLVQRRAASAAAGIKSAEQFDADNKNKYPIHKATGLKRAEFYIAPGVYYKYPPSGYNVDGTKIKDASPQAKKLREAEDAKKRQNANKQAATAAAPKSKENKHYLKKTDKQGSTTTGDWFQVTKEQNQDTITAIITDNALLELANYVKVKFISKALENQGMMPDDKDNAFYVPIANLTFTPDTAKNYAQRRTQAIEGTPAESDQQPGTGQRSVDTKKTPDEQQADDDAFQKSVFGFMDPDKNAIVKSFESVSGKGLAGFIESMTFDWYDKVTWDLDTFRKAPKMCKISISFAPVHDISPGLDKFGHNRAPIYPLGAYGHGIRTGQLLKKN